MLLGMCAGLVLADEIVWGNSSPIYTQGGVLVPSTGTYLVQLMAGTNSTNGIPIAGATASFDFESGSDGYFITALDTVALGIPVGEAIFTRIYNARTAAAATAYVDPNGGFQVVQSSAFPNPPWEYVIGGTASNGSDWVGIQRLTVTANPSKGGTVIGSGTYTAGSNVQISATVSNGWFFMSWNDGATNNPYTITMPPTNITYTANFLINMCDITAGSNANGVIVPTGTVWVAYSGSTNFTITPNANSQITNVVVDGVAIGATNSYTFLNVTNVGHTITALFGIDQYSLNVTSLWGNPSPSGTPTNSWNTLINASVSSPVPNGTTQYICTGWIGSGSVPASGTTTNTSFTILTNSTIVWQWTTNYWLNTVAGGNGSVNVNPVWALAGSNVTITATPSNGYHFVNWIGDIASTNNPLVLTMSQKYSITANFAINTYDITASASTNGTIMPTGTVWMAYGGSTNFAITPNANYQITNVVVDGVAIGPTNSYTFLNITNGGNTITVLFGLNQYTLDVTSFCGVPVPSGVTTNAWNSLISASVGSPVLNGTTTQYLCQGWTMTGNAPVSGATNSFSMTQTNNATLKWLWRTNFWLATQAAGSGTVNITSGWYNPGTSVTIRAKANARSHFYGWSGDTNGATISGTNITVKMTSAKSIVANFGLYLNLQAAGLNNSTREINIALTPKDYSNKATGTTPFIRCYRDETTIGFSAPRTLTGGWKFTGWTGVDSQTGTNATLTIMSNTVVHAWYDPAPVVVITNPTSHSTYTATNKMLTIMGRASNQCGIVSVAFSNDRSVSGICTGTTNWSRSGITLYNGINVITVTAYDTYSNSTSRTLTVTYSSKYASLQNLELLEGGVVRYINMQDRLTPGVTNTIQWQIEAFEPVLSALKIHLPAGGSVTNVILNGALTGAPTNGASLIGDWQSMVYSFETNWIMPSSTGGTYQVNFLTARQDGYAYVNANIPDGIDSRPYGTDGKEIARDIGEGTTPEIQNDTLIVASPAFETLRQALYRRGAVVQGIEITNNLIPGNVVTCRWSLVTYPSLQARLNVDLPNGSNLVGTATLRATSNTWWRLPASGKLVEYNGSVSNDALAKVSSYYNLKQYYYQYAWKIPANNDGPCRITFEVAPPSLTNWVDTILPENADTPNTTAGVTIERLIGP